MSRLDELIKELCPDGVEYRKVGDIADYEQPSKYLVKSTDYNDDFETPVLTAGQTFILGYTNEKEGIYLASKEKPVIIFDDFTGAFKWVDFPFKAKSSAMKMITAKENVLIRYLYHLMEFLNYSSDEHKRLWISTYSKFMLPVPPLEVQREIVRILDSFTLLTAELTAELTARKKQYEFYRDELLTFSNDELQYKKLGDIFTFRNGLSKGKNFFGSGFPFVRYTDVYNNRSLHKENIEQYVECTPGEVDKLRVSRGDVLFTRTSETAEDVGWSSVMLDDVDNCVFNGFTIKASPITDDLLPEYCAYCFSTNDFRKYITSHCAFTTRASLTGSTIAEYKIAIPSHDVQRKIAYTLDNFEKICNDLNIGLPAEIEARQKQYEYYRDLLLTFAETGNTIQTDRQTDRQMTILR